MNSNEKKLDESHNHILKTAKQSKEAGIKPSTLPE